MIKRFFGAIDNHFDQVQAKIEASLTANPEQSQDNPPVIFRVISAIASSPLVAIEAFIDTPVGKALDESVERVQVRILHSLGIEDES